MTFGLTTEKLSNLLGTLYTFLSLPDINRRTDPLTPIESFPADTQNLAVYDPFCISTQGGYTLAFVGYPFKIKSENRISLKGAYCIDIVYTWLRPPAGTEPTFTRETEMSKSYIIYYFDSWVPKHKWVVWWCNLVHCVWSLRLSSTPEQNYLIQF